MIYIIPVNKTAGPMIYTIPVSGILKYRNRKAYSMKACCFYTFICITRKSLCDTYNKIYFSTYFPFPSLQTFSAQRQ